MVSSIRPALVMLLVGFGALLAACASDAAKPAPTTVAISDEGTELAVGDLMFTSASNRDQLTALHACLCERYDTPLTTPFVKSRTNRVSVEWSAAGASHFLETSTVELPDVQGVGLSAEVTFDRPDGSYTFNTSLTGGLITDGDGIWISVSGPNDQEPLLVTGSSFYDLGAKDGELTFGDGSVVPSVRVPSSDPWADIATMHASPEALAEYAHGELDALAEAVHEQLDRELQTCVSFGESQDGAAPLCVEYATLTDIEIAERRTDFDTYIVDQRRRIADHAETLHTSLVDALPADCLA